MAFFRPDIDPKEREETLERVFAILDRIRPKEEEVLRDKQEAFALLDRIRPKTPPPSAPPSTGS